MEKTNFRINTEAAACGVLFPNFTTELISGCFYLSYNHGETAFCIPGEDGIPVAMIVLHGDHRDAFQNVIKNNQNSPMGECLRYIGKHQDELKSKGNFIGGIFGLEVTKFRK